MEKWYHGIEVKIFIHEYVYRRRADGFE